MVEELLGPVMDAIHQLEADQPMLSFIKPLWQQLQTHFTEFTEDNADLAKGEVPADKRKKNPKPTKISLLQLLEQDRVKLWHLAMDAAAVLDPVCWKQNARKLYHVLVSSLEEKTRERVDKLLTGFAEDEEDAERELTELEVTSFPQRFNKVLDLMSRRTEVRKGKRTVIQVQPSNERVDFYNNSMGEKVPAVTRAVSVLLSICVTACGAERNWSR